MVVQKSDRREQVLKLIAEKDALESRIRDNGRILQANNVGMTEPLVDNDGFPRNDIDVHQIRGARHQIICLQNDLKALVREIEKGLHEVHAEAAADVTVEASTKMHNMHIEHDTGAIATTTATPLRPIVRVNLVVEGSPAEIAGIQLNDEIIEFGSLNAENFVELRQIADIVKHRENQTIVLKVQRPDKQVHELRLVPKPWYGRGLLGCNICLCTNDLSENVA